MTTRRKKTLSAKGVLIRSATLCPAHWAVRLQSSPEGGAATRALFALEGGLLPKEVLLPKEASPARGGSKTAVRLHRRAAAPAEAAMF